MTANIIAIERLINEPEKIDKVKEVNEQKDTIYLDKFEEVKKSLTDQFDDLQKLLNNNTNAAPEITKTQTSSSLLIEFFDYITLDYNFNTISETMLNQKLSQQFKKEMVERFLELQDNKLDTECNKKDVIKGSKEGSLAEDLNHVEVDDILNVPSLPISMMSDDDPNFKLEVFKHL